TPFGPSIRKRRPPSSACSRLTASFGRTTPSEFPIFRTLSSNMPLTSLYASCYNNCINENRRLQGEEGVDPLLVTNILNQRILSSSGCLGVRESRIVRLQKRMQSAMGTCGGKSLSS